MITHIHSVTADRSPAAHVSLLLLLLLCTSVIGVKRQVEHCSDSESSSRLQLITLLPPQHPKKHPFITADIHRSRSYGWINPTMDIFKIHIKCHFLYWFLYGTFVIRFVSVHMDRDTQIVVIASPAEEWWGSEDFVFVYKNKRKSCVL